MRTSRLPFRFFSAISVLCVTLFLAGCASNAPFSTLDPQGTHAQRIYELLIPMFWAALAVFVVVELLLIYAVIRFRSKPNSQIPAQIHGNTRIEIMWTIAPALIVLVLAVLTFRTQAENSYQPPDAMQIEVIGHQWWWEYRYPEQGIVTANDLYIPVGRDVTLQMTGADVIHSVWVPKLAGKTDAIPTKQNRLTFRADQEGIYRGHCAEFCGEQHAIMRFRVVAVSQEAFDNWVQQQKNPPAEPVAASGVTGDPTRGRQLILEKGCVGCHAIAGYPEAAGVLGPNLTYFGSRETIGAGALPNTPENLALWLRNPGEVKPGNIMSTAVQPGTLSEQEIADLVAYLSGMRLSIEKPELR